MNFTELFEGATPKLPGAVGGIKVMSMDQFLAQSDDLPDEELDEATKLPAQTRELKGKELDDYLDRIRNREKGKTDKYKLPYIHRSSVVFDYT